MAFVVTGCEWREVEGGLVPFKDGQRLTWAPQGSQAPYLACPTVEVLYESNRGPGKTDALLMDFAQDCGVGWGADWRGLIFRKSYPDLQDVISKSQKWFNLMYPQAQYNEAKSFWEWPDGERLYFRQFAKPADYWKYHGHAYPFIGWEELCNWADDKCYLPMFSCLRSTRAGMPRKVRSTANPYGVGHNWVKARWRLPVPHGHVVGPLIVDPESGLARRAIHGQLSDNKVLLHADPDYLKNIITAARSPAELAAWRDGSWDIVAGGMFDDVWATHKGAIVVEPFAIPPSWRIDRSLDWGSSKPSSCGYWAESDGTDYLDGEGRTRSSVRGDLFRIGEVYTWSGRPNEGSRINATELCRRLREYEVGRGLTTEKWSVVRAGPADSSIFDEENDNCIATDLARPVRLDDGREYRGIEFERADKKPGSRKQGWERVRRYMKNTLPPEPGAAREEPGLFVFSNCTHWLRTVPSLPRDEKDPDDVDTEAEDHCGDETRYRVRLDRTPYGGGHTSGGY